MNELTNISAYQFARLSDLKPLREELLSRCKAWDQKGTILLSTEGINLFVSGKADSIEALLAFLRTIPGLAGLQAKYSPTDRPSFTRMLVKVKKEIIAFGNHPIDPLGQPAPRIGARELKQWLDQGRPVTLLDTRNQYEIELGTFEKAISLGIDRFRDFPRAMETRPPESFPHPIVTFCTGGIRCEKAAPYLLQKGYTQVYQLDGGILKYFEECGSEHFQGQCFVFDKRVGLAADLDPSGHALCFACQHPLTPADLRDPRTVHGKSCPHCHEPPDIAASMALDERQRKIEACCNPLPGSTPLDNFRPLKVSASHEGLTVLAFLTDLFPHFSASSWVEQLNEGNILGPDRQAVAADHRVRPGERYFTLERSQIEPEVNPAVRLIFEDDALIIIDKPAPLPMHPCGRFQRNTLQWILGQAYFPQKPRPAHRLDANTSGIAVFTRTAAYARVLQPQFERGEVEKEYLARVVGHPPEDHWVCDAPISETMGLKGARTVDPDQGSEAITHFETLTRFFDGTSLLRVVPKTGRTNQIRVHLWHLGWPILGDPMYLSARRMGTVQTLRPIDPPMCLCAQKLTFAHPITQERCSWEVPLPDWALVN